MAEKNSKSKNVENSKSTLATTQEKSTKTTASKVAKADGAAKASPAKATTPKSTATKQASTKTADSKSTKSTVNKTDSEKASQLKTAKATSTKVAEPKSSETKKATTKSTTNSAKSETSANTKTKNETEKVAKTTANTSKEKNSAEKASSVTTKTTQKKQVEEKNVATTKDTKNTVGKTNKKEETVVKKANTAVSSNVNAYDKVDSKKTKSTETKVSTKLDSAKNTTDKNSTAQSTKKTATKSANNADAEVLATKKSNTKNVENKNSQKSKFDFASIFAFTKKSKDNSNNAKNNKSTSKNSNEKTKQSLKERLAAIVASDNAQNDKATNSSNSPKGNTLTFKDFITNKKLRLYAISALILLLVFIIILSASIGAVAANKDKLPGGSAYTVKDNSLSKGATYDYEYRTTAVAGYTEEFLGYVDRKIPKDSEITNEGMVTNPNMYPQYGYTPRGITAQDRQELINEAWQLCSINTRIGSDGYPRNTYNRMDKDGNLYLNDARAINTKGEERTLYKHTSAVNMYHGNVSDDEKAIIKKMTFNPRSFHNHSMYNVTGIYAPAGEVIKVEISEEDMETTGGIIIHIGQALYNAKANNIWLAKGQMQRFPVILNTMVINKDTAEYDADKQIYKGYVGSFLGGPLYVCNEAKTFSVTISGGVRYSHFILGHTTPEDFETNKDSTAPYFDLEVWDNGCLHSGPKRNAQNFSYDDLFKVAELWDKITSVTTTGNNQNIVFLYDPFVAAGAAVAFPGQYSVNCPEGWMGSSLNYEALIKGGSWGNFHEYHHNFQGYGVGNGGEVTNNALTLVSYALFTKISANRRVESLGASGLGGWNSYTSATWALDQVKAISDPNRNPSNGNQGLALYATLLHNFGPEAFIQVRKLGGGQSYLNYFKKWEQYTHNNMTYYFKEMLKADEFGNMTDEWLEANSNPDYPMFVPVSCVYQTGRSYTYDDENRYIQTMQPYVIPYGQEFTIDLSKYTVDSDGTYKSGSIVMPEGFSYKIVKITQPENGTLSKVNDYVYNFNPNKEMQSGEIYVTLQITKDDNAFKVNNVDLVLGFEQSHELTGRMLERTTYEFEGEQKYTDAVEAFENNYAGYTNKLEGDNVNKTQNSNTDIWLTPAELTSIKDNTIMEVKGKLYIDETTRYRIALRGRYNVALYLSFDNGATYQKAGQIVTKSSATGFYDNLDTTYYETPKGETLNAGSWVYFKAVLIVNKSSKASFVGVGMAKVPDPMPKTDEDGNIILKPDGTPDEIITPVSSTYANAYRESYQFAENSFEPEYFYTKTYSHAYTEAEQIINTSQSIISYSNFEPYAGYETTRDIDKICDGDINTFIHSKRMPFNKTQPFEIEIKFAEPITANKFRIHYSKIGGAFIASRPKNYTLEVKLNENDDWILVADVKDAACANYMHTYSFNKYYTFQYYRFVVTDTYYDLPENDRFMVINELQFISQLEIAGGSRTGVGDKNIKLYGTWNIQSTQSKFGRVYIGKENSSMEFEFTGTRLILFSSINYGRNFEVYIDGKKVNSINFTLANDVCNESFISDEMLYKKHSVTIKCLGEANFESIVIVKP